jgi:hypothetical protein
VIIPIVSYLSVFVLAIVVAITFRPVRGQHELERSNRLDFYPATLAPLPAPEQSWEPRAIEDVPWPVLAVPDALRAVRHPCYQYAARLAAMSWQDHKTLQRIYDMATFTIVINALERHEVRYA